MTFRRGLSVLGAAAALALFVDATAGAQLVPPNFDHLKCYKVKDFAQKKLYKLDLLPEQRPPFNFEQGCKLLVPAKLFCIDVVKQNVQPPPPGAAPGQKAGDYLCYKVACPKQTLPMLVITDQFGKRDVQIKPPQFLCAPATKDIQHLTPTPPAPTPTPTRTPGCGFDAAANQCGGPCPLSTSGTAQQCVFVVDPATGVGDCDCRPPNPACHPAGQNTCVGPCPDARDQCRLVAIPGAPPDCQCKHPCSLDHTATPQCSGDCSVAGEVCSFNSATGACDCGGGPTPCGSTTAPQCDGVCPNPGEACVPTGPAGSPCFCETGTPPPCGNLQGPPQCLGACPANQACIVTGPAPGNCICQ